MVDAEFYVDGFPGKMLKVRCLICEWVRNCCLVSTALALQVGHPHPTYIEEHKTDAHGIK